MSRHTPTAALALVLLAVAPALPGPEAVPGGGDLTAQPTSPPADWGPVSINLEDLPYPHPVHFLDLTLEGQRVRMAYMDVAPTGQANGRTAVLLHGMNFFGEYWAGTIAALTSAGFRVVVPDQIGYGRSSKPILHYSLHLGASNTKKLLDHLGIQRAAIVGHSQGGMYASRFAFSYPETVTHLVLANQIGLTDSRLSRPWRDTHEAYASGLERSYEEILRGQVRYYVEWKPEYLKYVRIHYGWTLSGDWPRMAMVRTLLGQMNYADPVVYDWPFIETKAMVIGGEEDGENYPELARNVAESLQNAELVLFPGVGHNPQFEIPDRFHAELIRFLRSDPATRASSDWRR